MEKLFKIAIGAVIGHVVSEVAADILWEAGVPKRAATVAGGIIASMM